MTEKQRWLLRELETWKEDRLGAIGRYEPKQKVKEPRAVKAARRQQIAAERVISRWRVAKDQPWRQAKAAIEKRATEIRRIILFERTATALAAIKALPKGVR